MKVSVVMATYNGEKYIYEQINSIYKQIRQPDEVIICDDCSKDKTTEIIREFIKTYNLNNWHLTVNSTNMGWQKNFLNAMGESNGDYIFFCDQDDIWYDDKIETMVNIMITYPEIQCLSGKAITIDGNGNIFKGRNIFSAATYTGNLIQYPFSKSFNTAMMTGCTMCCTRKLADIVTQIGSKHRAHDIQICRIGILLDGVYILDRPVIYRRLHEQNSSGVSSNINYGSSELRHRINAIEENLKWLKHVLELSNSLKILDKQKIHVIERTISFQQARLKFLSGKSFIQYVKLIKYFPYYSGFSMYIGDFSYAFGINKLAGKILWYIKKILI